jgi:hypothetical protein
MNFIKIPGFALALLLLVLALSYRAGVSQLRVDELRVGNAEKKLEQISQLPYDNPVYQAGMTADVKLVLETAKRDQRMDKMEASFYLIVFVTGATLLIYKWAKR